jgi:hypothetical protein
MTSTIGRSFVLVCCVAMTACADTPEEPVVGAAPAAAGDRAAIERTAPEEAAVVAHAAIRDWLQAIPRTRLQAYGFADESELSAATLGEPVALHEIQPEAADPAEIDPNACVEAVAGQYVFPVMVGGRPRAFLRTRNVGGRFQVTGFGDAEIAAQYGIAAARWPAAQGFRLRLARREGGADFLMVDDGAATHLVPLRSAARVFQLGTPPIAELELSDLPPTPAVMAKVRAVAQRDPLGRR